MADEKTLYVISTIPRARDGGDKVALAEVDPRHPTPDGWVMVAGDKPTEVARTARVQALINDGTLKEVKKPGDKAALSAQTPEQAVAANPLPDDEETGRASRARAATRAAAAAAVENNQPGDPTTPDGAGVADKES